MGVKLFPKSVLEVAISSQCKVWSLVRGKVYTLTYVVAGKEVVPVLGATTTIPMHSARRTRSSRFLLPATGSITVSDDAASRRYDLDDIETKGTTHHCHAGFMPKTAE